MTGITRRHAVKVNEALDGWIACLELTECQQYIEEGLACEGQRHEDLDAETCATENRPPPVSVRILQEGATPLQDGWAPNLQLQPAS